MKSGTGAAAAATPASARLVEGLLLALLGLHVLGLVAPVLAAPAEWTQGTLLAALIPLALARARRPTLILTALVAAGTCALLLRHPGMDAPWKGLRNATVFAAFLPLLQFLRAFAASSAVVKEVQARFADLSHRQARSAFAVGGFSVGSFLSTGAHAVLGPLVPPQAGDDERRSAALAAIRGISLAAFWSPFFLQVAFVTRSMPDVPSLSLLALGFLWGILALVAELAFSGASFANLARILRGLAPLAFPAAAAAGVLLAVMLATGWSPLQTVIVVLPLAGLGQALFGRREHAIASLKAGYGGIARVSDEVLIVTGASIFSAAIAASSADVVSLAPALAGLSAPVLLAVVMAFMLATGALGVHPSIAAASLIGIFAGMPAAVDRLALALTLLVGWALSAVISPVSLNALVAGQMFRMSYRRLVLSRNIAFALALGAATVAVLPALGPG